jgi:hypothetical protein
MAHLQPSSVSAPLAWNFRLWSRRARCAILQVPASICLTPASRYTRPRPWPYHSTTLSKTERLIFPITRRRRPPRTGTMTGASTIRRRPRASPTILPPLCSWARVSATRLQPRAGPAMQPPLPLLPPLRSPGSRTATSPPSPLYRSARARRRSAGTVAAPCAPPRTSRYVRQRELRVGTDVLRRAGVRPRSCCWRAGNPAVKSTNRQMIKEAPPRAQRALAGTRA